MLFPGNQIDRMWTPFATSVCSEDPTVSRKLRDSL